MEKLKLFTPEQLAEIDRIFADILASINPSIEAVFDDLEKSKAQQRSREDLKQKRKSMRGKNRHILPKK